MPLQAGNPGHARITGTVARGQSAYARAARREGTTTSRRTGLSGSSPSMAGAACAQADPLLFFGADAERERAKIKREAVAVKVCASCRVIESCRAWVAANPDLSKFGVWAGTGEAERSGPRKSPAVAPD
jgi:WhiB family redox-sensing transcriptional regulator